MRIQFVGACQEVTGSMHLVEAQGKRILFDCGMKQGKGPEGLKTPQNLPFQPEDIDFIVLSHAHVDHSGLLPWLVDRGFEGNIISTGATKELCDLLLQDSAKIMKEEYEKGGEFPLYNEESVLEAVGKFKPIDYQTPLKIGDGIEVKLYDAGHILGSAIAVLDVKGSGTICYTGDLGHGKSPILNPPAIPEEDINWLIMESTYGNREHNFEEKARLAQVINETIKNKKGKLLIPVFAVGRSQELIYDIKQLMNQGKIPRCKIYMDTPMGFSATELYRSFGYCLREEFYELFLKGNSPFELPELDFIKGHGRSMEVATSDERCIVLAASGMLEGGRIMNHLPHVLGDENSTILFVGYQADGTLGRQILDGRKLVEIDSREQEVKCTVEYIRAYSAHADRNDLLQFVNHLRFAPHRVFVVHGESDATNAIASQLKRFRASAPRSLESFESPESRVEKIEEFKLGYSPSFEEFFEKEVSPVTGLLVKEEDGITLLNKTLSQQFIGDLMEEEESRLRKEIRKAKLKVEETKTGTKTEKEAETRTEELVEATSASGAEMDFNQFKERLQRFREAKLLTNRLIKEVYCELMERGKNEAIRLLNLKKEKRRYNIEVGDEELKEEFHQFMVNSISRFDVEVICRELKEINPNASCE